MMVIVMIGSNRHRKRLVYRKYCFGMIQIKQIPTYLISSYKLNSTKQANKNINHEPNNNIPYNPNQSVNVYISTKININILSNHNKVNVDIRTTFNINILFNLKKDNVDIFTNSILTYLLIPKNKPIST